jgi:hypothetical protein
MSESFPQDCWLYKPGHKTHFIQLNVMRDKERFPAEVELIDLETLEIKYNGRAVQLKTHDAVGVHFDCLHAFENEISFAPEAQLLYINVEGPTELTKGAWRPVYLARGKMQDCAARDEDSGLFGLSK